MTKNIRKNPHTHQHNTNLFIPGPDTSVGHPPGLDELRPGRHFRPVGVGDVLDIAGVVTLSGGVGALRRGVLSKGFQFLQSRVEERSVYWKCLKNDVIYTPCL